MSAQSLRAPDPRGEMPWMHSQDEVAIYVPGVPASAPLGLVGQSNMPSRDCSGTRSWSEDVLSSVLNSWRYRPMGQEVFFVLLRYHSGVLSIGKFLILDSHSSLGGSVASWTGA